MGVGYVLVYPSKQEYISYTHIGASTLFEMAGNPVAAAITSWYLLHNAQYHVAFVSDTYGEWPFETPPSDYLDTYRDMTDEVVAALVEANILADHGREVFDEAEPEVYLRRLQNIWGQP